MNDTATLGQVACPGVTVTDHVEGLVAIREAGVSAVVWRRPLPAGFEEWMARLSPDRLPSAKLTLPAGEVAASVTALCDESGMPDTTLRRWLIEDIAALSRRFAAITQVTRVRLRLDVVRSITCPKFHVDAVPARMLCTYRGAGTQFAIVQDGAAPGTIFDSPTGAPLLLRGKQWQDDTPTALRHRSPSFNAGDPARLLLVLDPVG